MNPSDEWKKLRSLWGTARRASDFKGPVNQRREARGQLGLGVPGRGATPGQAFALTDKERRSLKLQDWADWPVIGAPVNAYLTTKSIAMTPVMLLQAAKHAFAKDPGRAVDQRQQNIPQDQPRANRPMPVRDTEQSAERQPVRSRSVPPPRFENQTARTAGDVATASFDTSNPDPVAIHRAAARGSQENSARTLANLAASHMGDLQPHELPRVGQFIEWVQDHLGHGEKRGKFCDALRKGAAVALRNGSIDERKLRGHSHKVLTGYSADRDENMDDPRDVAQDVNKSLDGALKDVGRTAGRGMEPGGQGLEKTLLIAPPVIAPDAGGSVN